MKIIKKSGGSAELSADEKQNLAQAGRPSRLYNTLKRIVDARNSSKPYTLSTLTIGDSWALDVTSYLRSVLPNAGALTAPISATEAGGATVTAAYSEYAKTPWGQSIVLDASGELVTWGSYSGGVKSAGRFGASRFACVAYEAVSGGGSFKVQYEDRAGAWVDVATVNTDNSGASAFTIWESTAFAEVQTPRIRTVWVSGSCKIYAAGASMISANAPAGGTNRNGMVHADVSYGGSSAVQWDSTPQSAWTALLGWLKTDIVFIRERREASLVDWNTAIDSLVSKLRTARPAVDIIMVGSHPTTEESGAASDRATDEFLKSYCEANDILFVDMRSFFPASYDASLAIGLQAVDGVHQSAAGLSFSKSVLWQHLEPLRLIGHEFEGTSNGPKWCPEGVQGSFGLRHDANVADLTFGTSWAHRGETSPAPGIQIVFKKRDTSIMSEGFQWTYQTQPFWQMDSANRHLFSATGSALNRTLTATLESLSGQTGRVALAASGYPGQTANIFEIKTGVGFTATGTVVSGASANGRIFSVLGVYADDAAADADSALPSGGFYRTTPGGRTVYQKP